VPQELLGLFVWGAPRDREGPVGRVEMVFVGPGGWAGGVWHDSFVNTSLDLWVGEEGVERAVLH